MTAREVVAYLLIFMGAAGMILVCFWADYAAAKQKHRRGDRSDE